MLPNVFLKQLISQPRNEPKAAWGENVKTLFMAFSDITIKR